MCPRFKSLRGGGFPPPRPHAQTVNSDVDLKDNLAGKTCSAAGGQTVNDIKVVSMSELDPVGLENVVVRLNFKSNVIDFSNRPPGQSIRPN